MLLEWRLILEIDTIALKNLQPANVHKLLGGLRRITSHLLYIAFEYRHHHCQQQPKAVTRAKRTLDFYCFSQTFRHKS